MGKQRRSTSIALSRLEGALNDPSKMVKCPFCPKVFVTQSQLEEHTINFHGRTINSSSSENSSISLIDLIIMPFKILGSILVILFEILMVVGSAGSHNNAEQVQNSNYYSGTTYRCINGHQITSVTIPTKCPFCGKGMF